MQHLTDKTHHYSVGHTQREREKQGHRHSRRPEILGQFRVSDTAPGLRSGVRERSGALRRAGLSPGAAGSRWRAHLPLGGKADLPEISLVGGKPSAGGEESVTLIAGFKCSDGYMICSDSQETVGDLRAPAVKLSAWTEGKFNIAIAGSGNNGDLIDALEERLRDELANNLAVSSLRELKDLIQVEFREFQRVDAVRYPKNERQMRFVIGACVVGGTGCVLWQTKGTMLRAVTSYCLVGFEDERYKFAAEGYLNPNPIPTTAQAIFLGLYLMWLGEQTSNYVKAPVHVALIRAGQIVFEKQDKTNALFERVKVFAAQFDKLFLSCPDTGLQHGKFAERLNDFIQTIVQLRRDYVEEWVGNAVEEGLDKVIDPYPLIAPGQIIVVHPTRQQSASLQRMQEEMQSALRNNSGHVQEKDRIIANLLAVRAVLENSLGGYRPADHEPTEEEKTAYNNAHAELMQASMMGPHKVGADVVSVLQQVVSFLQTKREDLTGYSDSRWRDAVHLARFAVIECAIVSLASSPSPHTASPEAGSFAQPQAR